MNYGEFLVPLLQSLAFEVQTPYVLIFMALAICFIFPTIWIHVNAGHMISLSFGTCLVIL